VPSKKDMQDQLADFIEETLANCKFNSYYEQGFEINLGESEAKVSINDENVILDLDMDLRVVKNEETSLIGKHEVTVDSRLGSLYDSALKIYEHEQENLFLEDYGIDNLRLYAPVDGVEIQCSPLTWNANSILENLQNGIQENTRTLKAGVPNSGSGEEKYFITDLSIKNQARFLNSKSWPYTFEVNPAEGNLLLSKPVGNEQGLGILGFCYVPYHYVYDYKYPVLVQVFNEDNEEEIFQFPMAVVIHGNNPRKALVTNAVSSRDTGLCEQKNTEIKVNVFDTSLNSVDAEISYECFESRCDIGKTSQGTLQGNFPQCVNGRMVANAEGFEEKEQQFSTINSGEVDIILEKLYDTNVNLKLDGSNYGESAVISFSSEDDIKTILYPEQRLIQLSQGEYEIQVSIYRESSITLPKTSSEQCMDIPRSGLGGFFGFTKEKCFTVDFPEQIISNSLSGGGTQKYFFLESELASSNILEISSQSLPIPKSTEELQDNYFLFEEKSLIINFT
jgi:hypothetical protein